MENIASETHRKYVLAFLLIILIAISFFIIKPFISVILTVIIVAYVFHPVYKKSERIIKNKGFRAILLTILIILIITGPLLFLINSIIKEISFSTVIIKKTILSGNIFEVSCENNHGAICKLSNNIKEIASQPEVRYYIDEATKKFNLYLSAIVSESIFSLPKRILDIFLVFFVMYYLFVDGEEIIIKLKKLIPLKEKHGDLLITRFNNVTYAVVFGILITAIIQGFVGVIGFYIFGLLLYKFGSVYSAVLLHPILWGIAMAIFALIPFLGTPIIWAPIAAYQIIAGIVASNSWQIGIGIGIAAYGFLIISLIDNIIKPKIISYKSKVHPLVIFLGVFGGLSLFGLIGIIAGPVILSLLITVMQIYREEV